MSIFIAVVKRNEDVGYSASFPDFPACAVVAPTIDHAIGKAKEALSIHVQHLLELGQIIPGPTPADGIGLGGVLLLTAIEIPDDIRMTHIDLTIPALSLYRIDAFAQRCGLSRADLFVEAVSRWARQEVVRSAGTEAPPSGGPTVFDLGNPLDLRVETIAAALKSSAPPAMTTEEERNITPEAALDDVTAELVRLLEDSEAEKNQGVAGDR